MPVTAAKILAYQKRIKQLQTDAKALTPETRTAVERRVQQSRQNINDLIKDAAGNAQTLPARTVPGLQDRIRGETDAMLRDVTKTLQDAQREAFTAGIDAGRSIAQSIDLGAAFNAPTTDLLSIAISHTAELVTSIATDLMPQVDGVLSRAVLGSVNPYKAMQEIDRLIGKGGATGVSYQAERIVRTEVNRVYSIALDKSMQDLAGQFKGAKEVMKVWVSGANRPGRRPLHQAMNGQKVPINKPFETPDGVKLMYPRDPGGPAKHVINCGCSMKIDEDSLLDALNEVTS